MKVASYVRILLALLCPFVFTTSASAECARSCGLPT